MKTNLYSPGNTNETKYSKVTLLLHLLLTLIILFLFYWFYTVQKKSKTESIQNNLKSIATLKIYQIENWRTERIGDANTIASNKYLLNDISDIHENRASTKIIDNLKRWYSSIIFHYGYENIKIIDTEGKILFSVPEDKSQLGNYEKKIINEVLKTKKIYFTDFHMKESYDNIFIDLMVPIYNKDSLVKEIIVFEIDPNKFLYPNIQTWPVESNTAETLIFEEENGRVVFLNELRHEKNTALKLKIGKEDKDVLAVQVINGSRGLIEGVDYRNIPVLGYAAPIKDTKWFLLSKIDKDEAYNEIKLLNLWLLGLFGFVIISAVSLFRSQIRKAKAKHFEQLYKLESEKKEVLKNYDYVVKNANDSITITDLDGNYKDANEKALSLFGYSKVELLKLNKIDTRAPEEKKKLANNLIEIQNKDGLIYETRLIRKNGTIFPVEISAKVIEIEGKKYFQAITRDITERKKTEESMRISEEKYRNLFSNMEEGVALHEMVYENNISVNYRIIDVNPKFESIIGIKQEKAKGSLATELYGTKEAPYMDIYKKVAETGIPYRFEVYFQPYNKFFSISVFSPEKGKFATIFSDITERKKVDEELRESERKFMTAFKNSPYSMTISSAIDNKFVDVNDIFLRDVGYTKEEIIGHTASELNIFCDLRDLDRLISKVLKDGNAYNLVMDFRAKSGKIINCMISTSIIQMNEKPYFLSAIVDISERIQTELRNQQLTRTYAVLSQINQTIVKTKDRNFLFDEICKIAVEYGKFKMAGIVLFDETNNKVITAASSEEITEGLPKIWEVTQTCKCNSFFGAIESIKENRHYVSNDYVNDFKDCDFIEEFKMRNYNSIALFPLRTGHKIIGMLELISDKKDFFNDEELALLNEVIMDISYALGNIETEKEKTKASINLTASENKFRKVFENAKDVISLFDGDRLVDINKRVSEMLGYLPEELLSKSPLFFSPEYQSDGILSRDKFVSFINEALKEETACMEWDAIRKDGGNINVEVTLNKVQIESKDMILATIHDITERKKYETGLKEAMERAEEMSRLKSSFLANMSHELRTPMTGILGFAEILHGSLNNKKEMEMADIILKSSKRLMNTLNQILDLSRIEADKIDLKMKNIDLSSIIRNSTKLFEILAKENNINLFINVENGISAMLDEQLFERVITNLVKNAIIYTEIGSVTIEAKYEKEQGNKYAVVKVIDTGIGIPDNLQKEIFEPFRQVSEGYSRNFEGTGLGLTITKRYVEMMNGTINVESKINEGSTFYVRFPALPKQEKINQKEKILYQEENKILMPVKNKVLVVEDDESNTAVYEYALKNLCETEYVDSGEKAIEMASKFTYDIIIMDIGLQGMSGIEAVKRIRKINGYKETPIIAATAFSMVGDKEKFLAEGCSHYVSKPFQLSELKNLILDLLGKI
jgi:PAS domain S-box-containing protein